MILSPVKSIHTDGACSGNPGPGGWGTRIEFTDGQVHEMGGRHTATTNNRMEMQAAIEALEFLKDGGIDDTTVSLHTDSQYLIKGITQWIKGWKRKGWKNSAGKPVLNKDLWQDLDQLTQDLAASKLNIKWNYVRGHAGDPGNERCDEIARAYSHAQPINLSQYRHKDKASAKEEKSTKVQPVVKLSTKSTEENIQTKSKTNDKSDNHKDLSLDNPEIKAGTKQEPSSITALRFNENDPQEESQAMTASISKNSSEQSETARITRLRNALETLQVTDELAKQGYLITSAELADLMDVNASAVTSRGDYWAWRNWTVSRIRREGNQILWQLERIDE